MPTAFRCCSVKVWVHKLLTGDSVTAGQKIAMIWLSRNYHLNIITNQLLFMLLVPHFQSTRSLSWSWTRIFINVQYCGSDIFCRNLLTCSCLSCSEATDFSQAKEHFSKPRKKKLLFLFFFFPKQLFSCGVNSNVLVSLQAFSQRYLSIHTVTRIAVMSAEATQTGPVKTSPCWGEHLKQVCSLNC